MIRIQGPSEPRQTAPAKKTGRAGAAFKAGDAKEPVSSSASGVSESAPASMLSALIALQSDGGGNAKTFAAAQRTLDLLEQLQMKFLEGRASAQDLDALSQAALMRAHAGADAKLLQIYDEIALRAKVELAKLGR